MAALLCILSHCGVLKIHRIHQGLCVLLTNFSDKNIPFIPNTSRLPSRIKQHHLFYGILHLLYTCIIVYQESCGSVNAHLNQTAKKFDAFVKKHFALGCLPLILLGPLHCKGYPVGVNDLA